jgi:hypothetical protein
MGDHDALESVITIGWNTHISRTSTFGGEGCDLAVMFDAPNSCSGGFRPLPSERA